MTAKRHRWGEPARFPLAHKTERTCTACGLVKVTRHESEGGRDLHWTEFWRDGVRIVAGFDSGGLVPATPPCVTDGGAA